MRPFSERFETASAQETEALGARLAAALRPGDLVLVEGELGAGKTTLVRGAVRALGHAGRVTSPTFTLASRYEDARLPVSHLDLYRLRGAGADEEDLALLDDELAGDRVVFVEWPEALAADELGRPPAVRVVLRHAGGDRRAVEVVR
ncbi:MAG TPA: tRNA (adenosine(37)-N6)-threonylcarbamoyltransferase complex ATPase subunit type 1 TsaE [Solirubrobacteraceae bacterium]|jgi:tRNA threonylcarbamoyladenosine biosynthesis protein TsaE